MISSSYSEKPHLEPGKPRHGSWRHNCYLIHLEGAEPRGNWPWSGYRDNLVRTAAAQTAGQVLGGLMEGGCGLQKHKPLWLVGGPVRLHGAPLHRHPGEPVHILSRWEGG